MKKRTTAWALPHGRRRRVLSVLLALALCLSLLPTTALAAQTGSSDSSRTVFDALGFDTKAPEGYEQDESLAGTPYGKTYTTMAEVDELFTFEPKKQTDTAPKTTIYRSLYGHNNSANVSGSFLTLSRGSDNGPISLQVEGNFSRDNQGQKKNVAFINVNFAYVGTENSEKDLLNKVKQDGAGKGALVNFDLGVMDPVTGDYDVFYRASQYSPKFDDSISNYYPSNAKDDAPLYLGNAGDTQEKKYKIGGVDDTEVWVWEFKAAYTAQNYLELAAGDFDGDSIDEIAVYIGESGNPRVEIWKLQDQKGGGYLNPDHYNSDGWDTGKRTWEIAWTYKLDQYGANIVPNMVSLAAADYDKDGIDDLAVSWGYCGPESSQPSHAVIMMGADNNQMMTRSCTFPLKANGTDIYRAGFTSGDVDNDGYNELVLGGSLANSTNDSRYLAIYEWTGKGFEIVTQQNFDLFEEENGVRTWQNIKDETKYYSMPFAPANIAVGKFYGIGEAPCIYLDSIVIQYGSDGFDILDLLTKQLYKDGPYAEWGARSADLTGSGQDTLFTLANATEMNTANSIQELFQKSLSSVYKNYYLLTGITLSKGSDSYGAKQTLSKTADYYVDGANVRNYASLSFSLPNTDNDTTILRYTGEHYYTYADPEVLAVLASPPYYADLANDDDDSQMIESSTSYGTTKGSGSGTSHSNSFSVGVYTSWEKTWSILGVELASAEAEFSINNTFTWETQKTSSLEYEVTYSTMAGLDTVVLYSMPIETYVYEATMPDGTTQTMTVNIPYEPSVQTIALEKYEEIRAAYSDILADVSSALTHTVGDPGSYASSISSLPAGRTQTLAFNGNPSTIGQGSQNTQEQSISMTSEEENSFNYEFAVETKAGAGMGGVKVGVTAGYSHGAGKVHISTAGSSYTGTMNGLPTQAEGYGYTFNWRLVGFLYQGRYPVVTYLVTNVQTPPLLPENFGASEDDTTTTQIALEWDYPGNAAGFVIYRYFQSPSASGYYKIGTVEGGDYAEVIDGVKHYQYIDEGLSPNTGYQYRIQTIGLSQPNTSIPSEALSTYTKPETGVPQVAVSTTVLNTFPDTVTWVSANITNTKDLPSGAKIYYQWQKQTARGSWEDVKGEDGTNLTFQYPSAGVEGIYRCKVSALADQNLVTAYSPEVTVTFAQREAEISDLTINGNTLTATVKGKDVSTIPAGTVSFTLKSSGAESTYTAKLDAKGVAAVTIAPVAGVYKVTADYSGSKVFLPASYDPETPRFYTKGITGSQTFIDAKDSYTYGDKLDFVQYTVDANGNITGSKPINSGSWRLPATFGYPPYSNSSKYREEHIQKRFANDFAGWVTDRAVMKADNGGNLAVIAVTPKTLTVTGLTDMTKSINELKDSDLYNEICSSLKLDGIVEELDGQRKANDVVKLFIYDTAGRQISGDITEPGLYTLRLTSAYDPNRVDSLYLENYTMILPTAKLFVTGAAYNVSAEVANGQTAYGSVSVASPKDAESAAVGQTIIFRAEPNSGYEVAGWTLNGEEVPNSAGQNTLTVIQTEAGAKAVVSFRSKQNTLTVTALPTDPTTEGAPVVNEIVPNENSYFKNGNAYATDYKVTFTPKAAEGWHFTGWEYHVTGQSPAYSSENTFTVEMPDSSVQLYAKFERNTYALTLGEHLTAYVDGEIVTDLSAIPGDTVVTVKPATGYQLASAEDWTITGADATAKTESELTFSIVSDTTITANVSAQLFQITLNDVTPEGSGTAKASATGEVAGGTQVTFSAEPARGYAFVGWKNGETTVSTDAAYTVTVGEDLALTPVFTAQAGKTVTVSTTDNNGSISWAIEGVETTADNTVTLYPGETLVLTAAPNGGKMVAGWTVNGTYSTVTDKTREFKYSELEANNTISVTFKAVTYFTVKFADGISATADGKSIVSGASAAAGSKVEFTYNSSDGTYVTAWKNNGTAYPSLTENLVIENLSGDLDISVETGKLDFFTVTDATTEATENYTVTLTGTYEVNDTYAAGSSVTITVTPKDGWRITGVDCGAADFTEENGVWTGTIERLSDDVTYTVTVEEAVTPPAPGTTFTITFNANGGTLTGSSTAQTDENGKLTSLPTDPTRDGYKFAGWFTATEGGTKITPASYTFTDDTILYAHWTEKSSTGGGGGGSTGGGGISAPSTSPVTPIKADGGSVSVNPSEAAKGDTVTITVTPDAGYEVDQVTVTDKNGKEIPVKDLGGGRYSFTMPGSKVTVEASFKAAGHNTFTDVPSGSYYADAVAWAVENGITGGISADTFAPNAACTRAQAVTFLWRAAGSPEPQSAETAFTDVKSGSYYEKAVAWAVENGITKGTSDTAFSPDAPCSRGQIVTFLWRSQKSPAAGTANPFTDVKPGDYYADAVLWAVSKGVTNGTTDTTFSPSSGCTRAQIVTFLWRCMK